MAPVRDRNENWPSTPRRRKNRTIRRRMKRQRAVASRAAFDSRGCPLSRAARAALAALAHRRTAGAPAAAPVPLPGAAAETAAAVATAALGESAAFSVALSSAAWPLSPPVPLAVVPPAPPPVLPARPPMPPAPAPAPVPAEGAVVRDGLASDTPAITPPPASSAARAIPTVQCQALRWSLGACAGAPGCCQGYPYPGPWLPGGTPWPGQNCCVGWSPGSSPGGRWKLSMGVMVPAGPVTTGSRNWDFPGNGPLVRSVLHPVGHGDPEQAEPGRQNPQRQSAEREPAVAQLGRRGIQHRA